MYPLTYIALSDPSHPATRHPEASHANRKVFRHGFRESRSPTRVVLRVGWEAKDRLRCTAGLSRIVSMIGCPEDQRSRSFASHP